MSSRRSPTSTDGSLTTPLLVTYDSQAVESQSASSRDAPRTSSSSLRRHTKLQTRSITTASEAGAGPSVAASTIKEHKQIDHDDEEESVRLHSVRTVDHDDSEESYADGPLSIARPTILNDVLLAFRGGDSRQFVEDPDNRKYTLARANPRLMPRNIQRRLNRWAKRGVPKGVEDNSDDGSNNCDPVTRKQAFLVTRRVGKKVADIFESSEESDQEHHDQLQFSASKELSTSLIQLIGLHWYKLIAVVVSSVISLVIVALKFLHISTIYLESIPLYIWTGAPAVLVSTYLLCVVAELLFLSVVSSLTHSFRTTTFFSLCLKSFDKRSRFVLFFFIAFKMSTLLNHGIIHEDSNMSAAHWIVSYAQPILKAIYLVALLFIGQELFTKILVYKLCQTAYAKDVDDILFAWQALRLACSQTVGERRKISRSMLRYTTTSGFYTIVQSIRTQKLQLPLERRLMGTGSNSQFEWVYSDDKIVEIATAQEMSFVAAVLFDNVVHSTSSKVMYFSQWRNLFLKRSDARRAYRLIFKQFQADGDGVSEDEFIVSLNRYLKKRNQLASSLKNFDNLTEVVNSIITATFWIAMIFVVANVFQKSVEGLIVSLSTILFSFTFALGSTIAKMFESCVFIFATKPYDVGDRVIIDDKTFVVHQINLMTTCFRDMTNKLVMISNQSLANKEIYNLRRSKAAVLSITVQIRFDVGWEKIEKLREDLLIFIESKPAVWKPSVDIKLYHSDERNAISAHITVQNRLNWQEGGSISAAKSELINELRFVMAKHQIDHMPPPRQLVISNAIANTEELDYHCIEPAGEHKSNDKGLNSESESQEVPLREQEDRIREELILQRDDGPRRVISGDQNLRRNVQKLTGVVDTNDLFSVASMPARISSD